MPTGAVATAAPSTESVLRAPVWPRPTGCVCRARAIAPRGADTTWDGQPALDQPQLQSLRPATPAQHLALPRAMWAVLSVRAQIPPKLVAERKRCPWSAQPEKTCDRSIGPNSLSPEELTAQPEKINT